MARPVKSVDYHMRRERQHRDMAAAAKGKAREAHVEMAEYHRGRVAELAVGVSD